jgi:hypothetical protein
VLLLLAGLAGGWALLGDRATWPDVRSIADWRAIEAGAAAWASRVGLGPTKMIGPPASPPAQVGPPRASLEAPALPTAEPRPGPLPAAAPVPSVTTTTLPPPAPSNDDPAASPSPLPPPASDPADPYRQRAEAVGLHPDLSRVLLDRLSPDDYRNAAHAIDTALAKTADGAVFVWPRQRKPEQALFKVHFVQSAAATCRRYVVTITKDGWLTTALPMERCGPARRSARSG